MDLGEIHEQLTRAAGYYTEFVHKKNSPPYSKIHIFFKTEKIIRKETIKGNKK